MLVLTFRGGEDAVITLPDGSEILVVMLDADRGRARVGFDAARNIVIDRREIYERKRAEHGQHA